MVRILIILLFPLKFYVLSDITSFGGTTVEREPLLSRTRSISRLSEIEPLLLASIVGGYIVTPYDFKSFINCNTEDDDNYLQVRMSVCVLYTS